MLRQKPVHSSSQSHTIRPRGLKDKPRARAFFRGIFPGSRRRRLETAFEPLAIPRDGGHPPGVRTRPSSRNARPQITVHRFGRPRGCPASWGIAYVGDRTMHGRGDDSPAPPGRGNWIRRADRAGNGAAPHRYAPNSDQRGADATESTLCGLLKLRRLETGGVRGPVGPEGRGSGPRFCSTLTTSIAFTDSFPIREKQRGLVPSGRSLPGRRGCFPCQFEHLPQLPALSRMRSYPQFLGTPRSL